MACLFGARLAPVAEVSLVGTWPEGLAALRQHGIRVEGQPDAAAARVQAARLGDPLPPARLVLVLVKAWQTARVANHLARLAASDGLVLTLQNGLGNYETLAAALGPERAALGTTTQGATLLGPGRVREGGRGPIHAADHLRLTAFIPLFRSAGFEFDTVPPARLDSLVWGKLAVNCGINALTALLRVPNGELLKRPDAARLMDQAALECAAVARARGVALPFDDPAARVREVAQSTAANHSSMFQDILRGARTEIEAINGAVAREGHRLDVPTPVNEALWRLVRALEQESED